MSEDVIFWAQCHISFSLTWIFINIFQTFKKDFKLFSNLCEPLWRFRIWIFQVFKFSGDLSVLYKLLHKLYVKHQQTIQLQLWCSWNWTSAKFWHSGNLTPLSIPPELNCIGNCKAELSGRSLEMRIWEDIIYRHHCRLAIWKWLVELKMVICHPQILAIVTEQHIVHWLTLTNSCTSYTLLRKWWYQRHCVIGWATPQVPKSLEGKIPKKVYDELQNILFQLSRSGFEENKIFITFGEQQLQLFLKVKVRTTCENFWNRQMIKGTGKKKRRKHFRKLARPWRRKGIVKVY